MDQYLSITKIREKLTELSNEVSDEHLLSKINDIDNLLSEFFERGIDYKEVVDCLDDSIFITDKHGNVIYVNDAYTKNTGIEKSRVLHHNVYDLINKDHLYSGGAIPDVLKSKKTVFRLSTTFNGGVPLKGYVVGTPLFDSNGELHQVVAVSRPIMSLKSLQQDFSSFAQEIQTMNTKSITLHSEEALSPSMIGKDTTLANIWNLISHVALSDATILITGESGAGKEVIADEIFRNSKRSDKPYIKINCASIPAQLLESELFGYEKGAFSGASAKGKPGLFELANNGTLLLDEIGDMSMDLQVKLLRAIQSQEITRIGGTKPIKLNIRFLALTNANLKEKIAEGTFRQDLYYRLNVIPIYVPPLRERTADIEALCNHYIQKFTEKYNISFALTPNQMAYLESYSWPGNIRELENIMEYLVLCSAGTGHCDDDIICNLLNISLKETPMPLETDLNTAMAGYEKKLIESALQKSHSLREAGAKLGINASTISRKIKQYGIEYPKTK